MFHPLVAGWFTETFGAPTAVQEAAWPLIAKGEDLLAVAPTGSGKTLTAFLAALSRFIDGSWDPEKLTVLYVSPLKALNEDIRRNLIEPVEALRKKAAAAALPFPGIRVETRSGDTPQAERRRFLIRPPSVLAVTPESLAILLLNPRGREALSQVRYLVLDEIHAVMGTKRGAFLSCQIDRLAGTAGSFQRIALSATVHAETAAEYAGVRRIVAPPAEKKIDFLVEFPREEEKNPVEQNGVLKADRYGRRYTVLVNYILDRIRNPADKASAAAAGTGITPNGVIIPERRMIHKGRITPNGIILVFTDSRRRAERIAYLVNTAAGERLALCHHGSLSKEVRRDVEQSLVRALVPCVVATSSLELGLDIGAVDEVILAGTPSSCAQTIQRVGRAGHGAGKTSRGRLLPFHGLDLLLGAVTAGAVADREIERIRPIKNPLDILAQLVLALITEKERSAGELYAEIRGFRVFRDLDRPSFDGVIAMLTGRLFRELEPRLYRDTDGKLYAAAGVLSLLYSSGGAIPGRGLYSMRLPDGTKIGELDEEFVWERRPGDSFDFGARPWTITAIGSEAVTVATRQESADFTPFWKADVPFRSPELSRRILRFFGGLNSGAGGTAVPALSEEAGRALEELLARQKEAQRGVPFSDSSHIPLEIIDDPAVRQDAYRAVFHTFRGGGVNYPLAMALAGILEEKTGQRIEAIPGDNAVLLLVPRTAAGNGRQAEALLREALRSCAKKRRGEEAFRRRLETSGIFGAAFREAAERSMILPRGNFGRRTPLWVMRRRAKLLYDRVSGHEDFPLISEAWRSCLEDRFDMEGFGELLEGLDGGTVRLCPFITGNPSPFARDLVWKETANFMYEYDERKDLLGIPAGSRTGGHPAPDGSLAGRAIAHALADPSLMPVIKAESAASFGARLRREIPGWAPEEARELARWVLDRVAIPAGEWELLRSALPEELNRQLEADPSLGGRLEERTLEGASLAVTVHAETAAALAKAEDSVLSRLGEWLRYEGPVSAEQVAAVFGGGAAAAEDALDALAEAGEAVGGIIVEGNPAPLYCDAENCDLLLRLVRKHARPLLAERPSALLVPFVALRQGLLRRESPGRDAAAAFEALAALAAYPLPVKLWETEILPARTPGACSGKELDALLEAGSLLWFGAGKEKTAFCTPEELELADPGRSGKEGGDPETSGALTRFCAVYKNFWEIRDHLAERGLIPPDGTALCAGLLWDAAWRGELSSDSWEAIRRGISRGFAPREETRGSGSPPGFSGIPGILPRYVPDRERRIPRALRERWREGAPVPGRWYALAGETDPGEDMPDSLLEEELNQDRVRLLLRRWGILCRPLLETEGCFSWSQLLPAMRRMELAGELVTGRFFAGIHSLQFASPSIAEELKAAEEAAVVPSAAASNAAVVSGAVPVYWMNAADPASPAGWNIDGLDGRLPPRTTASRLCFRGADLAAVSSRNGRDLELFIPPGDPDLDKALTFLTLPRTRACHPVQKITLERINGSSAAESPYAAALAAAGFIPDRGRLILWQAG
jgi:ATP-dependent Lhr-like helicase